MDVPLRFSIFGRLVDVVRDGQGWHVYSAATEGKREPAGFVIPDFVAESELVQYLEDLFHESATPTNGDVRRVA